MDSPSRYWKAVLILTAVLCVVVALAWFVVPQVRSGAVPAIGGLIWHPLGALRQLLAGLYGPVAAAVGQATTAQVGTASLVVLTAILAFVLSLVVCLPFRQRPKS